MTKKVKALIITLCSVLGVVITAVIFCFTLFTIKDVQVDFRTEITQGYTESQVIKESGIEMGKCVFFLKKSKLEEKIEKEFPYLEVINIETVIPSHIIFHIAEREEFYAINHNGQTLYCDDEFKVLRIEEGTITESDVILLENIDIKNKKVSTGDFLSIKQSGLLSLYDAMLLNSRGRPEMIALCDKIEVTEYAQKEVIKDGKTIEKEWQTTIKISTHSGREIYIYNINYGLEYKLAKSFAVMSSIFEITKFNCDSDGDGTKELYDVSDSDQLKKDKMYEILANAQIHIMNYQSEYIVNEKTGKIQKVYDEKDNYYSLSYNGNPIEKV